VADLVLVGGDGVSVLDWVQGGTARFVQGLLSPVADAVGINKDKAVDGL
jgi:hypothetical protein